MKKFSVEISGYTNCTCSVCFCQARVAKLKWYTQDYASNKRKGKICKNLQKHPHSIWICEKCMQDFKHEWIRSTRGVGFQYPDFFGEAEDE